MYRYRPPALRALALVLILPLAACSLVKTVPAPRTQATPSAPVLLPALPIPDEAVPSGDEAPVRTPQAAMPWLKPSGWNALPGWRDDNLAEAWPAWQQSCAGLKRQSAWRKVCTTAEKINNPDSGRVRDFFEDHFRVYQVNQNEGVIDGLVTGYYEPLLRGSRDLSWKYRYPLYSPPDDLLAVDLSSVYPELKNLRLRGRIEGRKIVPYYTRADLSSGKGNLNGKELLWVDDPVELFFLEVQGSGRVQLESGEMLRVGYADQNGYPYKSIGKWLIEKGELTLAQASMQGIKEWARQNPGRLTDLLNVNPSQVFFRLLPSNNGNGPLGALGVPLTPERSIAVDPRAHPLGAPVWLATTQPNSPESLNRLMFAQDTGGAIRGNVRADFFWGFGDEAGKKAGGMKQRGRMWLILPRDYPLSTLIRN